MTAGPAGADGLTEDSVHDLLEQHPKILVIGDLILDCWLSGTSERMTREAPVPVVEVRKRTFCGGGAANTALNLAALGAEVRLVGIVGQDEEGHRLVAALQHGGVDVSYLVRTPRTRTSTKTRVLAGDHVIVRLDTATDGTVPAEVLDEAVRALHRAAGIHTPWEDARIICDYDNGAVTGVVHDALVAARDRSPLCVLDAHRLRDWVDLRPDIITPNAAETSALIGLPLKNLGDRAAAVISHRAEILRSSGAVTAVVTLDRDGTVVVNDSATATRTFAPPAPEWRASGAGDTFTAALTFARACGWDLASSAHLAQAAANVAVSHAGTSICSAAELRRELFPAAVPRPARAKLLPRDDLVERLDALRSSGHRIVFTNGCFDLIHIGHTGYLQQARQLGDVLVVAVNSDDSARRLKGPGRPVNSAPDRAAVLAALSFVDYVTVFDEESPVHLIERIRPSVYAKGGDYTADMLSETAVVERCGGSVRILDYVSDHSTTSIVDRIRTGG